MTRELLPGVSANRGSAEEDLNLDPVMAALSAETHEKWLLERRFKGGSNGGAYLVSSAGGAKMVLKVQLSDPTRVLAADKSLSAHQRVLAAASMVAIARERGWPTPAWHHLGRTVSGEIWVLQDFVEGAPPSVIDRGVADMMIEVFKLQAGLLPAQPRGWNEWIHRVLYEDGEGLRARIHPLPGGAGIIGDVDVIADRLAGVPIGGDDLVHGDLNVTNMLLAPGGLTIIDAETLGSGPRAYDAVKTLMVASIFDQATEDGLERLWSYVRTLDAPEFALCSAAAALTITDGIVRHELHGLTQTVVSGVSAFLRRVQSLSTV